MQQMINNKINNIKDITSEKTTHPDN